ncbi:Histidine kinase-, DNA gyrase B-, and HSP90-like ATPase [Chitinophaga terrae (ex Kim and Jung 2007)]|uniref:histidine kinase n=1 Tax=Chitinophaga terrae (ex Kim and Jung 2007) TaxID=408074 RepID=A0A1H4DC69_9BACT|nr:HAMP domain-containing sensor histidine kinase [Chitinophaga terrae (ex Kim and Jung 2007)]SEA70096.1 Histidine kinase-, DNA gyrase B-, and HSP90-like ATPase [Chitinophaga terrae (ex Kim and Jung 2007)]
MHYFRLLGVCCLLFLYTALYAQRNEIKFIQRSLSRTTDSIQYADGPRKTAALYLGYKLGGRETYARSAYDIAYSNQPVSRKANAKRKPVPVASQVSFSLNNCLLKRIADPRPVIRIAEQQQGAEEADYLSYFFGSKLLESLLQEYHVHSPLLAGTGYNDRFVYYQVILILVIIVLVACLITAIIRLYKLSDPRMLSMEQWQQETERSNMALKENDDFKNKLLSMIAHDFRTPLHNIVSITGFVNERVLTPAEATAMIGQVDKTAAHTLQLFEEISKWVRTQLSGFSYQPEVLQVRELLLETVESLKTTLEEKEIKLLLDVPLNHAVQADYEMLQFVHRNFLHNAVKFSPDNGVIRIHTSVNEKGTTVYFTDEGSGIDGNILKGLFEWRHLSKDPDRVGKGAGIALIICKDFIEKMGGDIGAFNNEDEGSTFFYRLPHF